MDFKHRWQEDREPIDLNALKHNIQEPKQKTINSWETCQQVVDPGNGNWHPQ